MLKATRTPLLVTTALAAAALAQPSRGQSAPGASTDIGTVQAGGGAGGSTAPGTAAAVAPSRPPLSASQPTSVVGPGYIQNNVLPLQNYDEIIKFTPSVQNVAPVGPGLQQNFAETIRGFNYTQFNTLFDGIPIPGSPSNFAPQTEAYFTAHDIGSVEVDRGPGTASTIGYATFGGTVAITSKSPLDTVTINPYGTYGSFATRAYGVEADSGAVGAANGARGYIDLQRDEADGFLSGTRSERRNGFAKVEVPLGTSTVLTVVCMANNSRTHTPYGASLAEIQKYGYNYGLSGNPRSQGFSGYNVDVYTTDFEYVGVRSALGDGWSLDDKAYTASYYKRGVRGVDPNGSTPNLGAGPYYINGVRTVLTGDVPGYPNKNDFRDWGNLLRITKDTAYGQLRAGLWFDYVAADAYRVTADLSRGDVPYTTTAAGSPFSYKYRDTVTTVQPYAEFAWKPLPGLTITPGLKYTSFTRALDAAINNITKLPAKFNETYAKLQPAVDARYVIQPGWIAYAQVAKGFLGPSLNVLFTTKPQGLSPQETWNYQVGTAYQKGRLSLGADLYYIDFSNLITSQTVAGTAIYANGGGAIYQGIEVEGTVQVGGGLALYANGSLNDGEYKGRDVAIQLVPRRIAAAGPIYQRNGFYASLLAKYVGPQYLLDNAGTANQDPIKSYEDADLALGYTLPVPGNRAFNARFNVFNLFDRHALTGLLGSAANGTPLYAVLPGRSFFFTLSAAL
jgi:iron complex outermembrane receptor protein